MTRKIIHVDMDCFYAAVEMRDDPSLKGKPLAIGGAPEERGVIATANYPAREYGVHSAMPSHRAVKKCPDLILKSPNFDKYREESRNIRSIFRSYTDQIQPVSLDEAYLDVTETDACEGSATKIAREIRSNIEQKRRITASAGAAPNKFLAKVASDWNKPDGQKTIAPGDVPSFMKDLSVECIPGVGDVTLEKLQDRNIETCGALQSYSRRELLDTFGKWGLSLFHLCRGRDDRPVRTDRVRKSLSVERTFSEDLSTIDQLFEGLNYVYEKFQNRWTNTDVTPERIKSLLVKIKFSDFQQITRQKKYTGLPEKSDYKQIIKAAWKSDTRNVRLLGIGVQLHSRKKGTFRRAQKTLFS